MSPLHDIFHLAFRKKVTIHGPVWPALSGLALPVDAAFPVPVSGISTSKRAEFF